MRLRRLRWRIAQLPDGPSSGHRGRFELLLEIVDHLFDHLTGGGSAVLAHAPGFTRYTSDELPAASQKLDAANELLHPNPQTLGRKNVLYLGFGARK